MKFKRVDLEKQAKADELRFDGMGPSAKNALISELKKFWPITAEVWPTKFLYSETSDHTKEPEPAKDE